MKAAFLATGLPGARDAWERVAPMLDRYAAAWLGMYRDACEATQVRGEQSAETLDLRMAAGAGACSDIKLLRADVEQPRDQATRARVEDLRTRLATAKAHNDTGQHPRAAAEAEELEREARTLGYRPLLAEVLTTTGVSRPARPRPTPTPQSAWPRAPSRRWPPSATTWPPRRGPC